MLLASYELMIKRAGYRKHGEQSAYVDCMKEDTNGFRPVTKDQLVLLNDSSNERYTMNKLAWRMNGEAIEVMRASADI